MSVKFYDLIVLGSGEIAKAVIKQFNCKNTLVISRSVDNLPQDLRASVLEWDAEKSPFPAHIAGGLVINCVLPESKLAASRLIDYASLLTKNSGIYIHLSTIALYSFPKEFPLGLKFRGDWYIRIKRYEMQYLKKKLPKARVVIPGVVIGGDTSWDKFLIRVASSKFLTIGTSLDSGAPIISLAELAKVIFGVFQNGTDGNYIYAPNIDDSLRTWREFFLARNIKFSQTSYLFYPSKIKNLFIIILTSNLTPDFLWGWINFFAKKHNIDRTDVSSEDNLIVTGMTNFYIGATYNLK